MNGNLTHGSNTNDIGDENEIARTRFFESLSKLLPASPVVAEVGVQTGKNADRIYRTLSPGLMVLVDPWKHYGTKRYSVDGANVRQSRQNARYKQTRQRFADRKSSLILRTESQAAAKLIPDGTFDLVYLDAQHDYQSVRNDIAAWWRKIRAGGILSGHDYVTESSPEDSRIPYFRKGYGVAKAVQDFCGENDLEIHMLSNASWADWSIVKP